MTPFCNRKLPLRSETALHNVKVIVRNGHVTLKGPVASTDEKKSIEDKPSDLPGPDNVTSKLTVKS